jgi:hypothetical protein
LSSPFSSHTKRHEGQVLDHDYSFSSRWENAFESELGGGNHRWVRVTATCSRCKKTYVEQVNTHPIPNGLADALQDPCTNSNRVEYFAWDDDFTTYDDHGNFVFTQQEWWCSRHALTAHAANSHREDYIPGHSLQNYNSHVITPDFSLTVNCSYVTLNYKCYCCGLQAAYHGAKVTSSNILNYYKNVYGNKNYCIYELRLNGNDSLSMFVIEPLHSSVKPYRFYMETSSGKAYIACAGH